MGILLCSGNCYKGELHSLTQKSCILTHWQKLQIALLRDNLRPSRRFLLPKSFMLLQISLLISSPTLFPRHCVLIPASFLFYRTAWEANHQDESFHLLMAFGFGQSIRTLPKFNYKTSDKKK